MISSPILPASSTESDYVWFPVRITSAPGGGGYVFQEVWTTSGGVIADRVGGRFNSTSDPAYAIDGSTFAVTAAGSAVQVMARRAPGMSGVGWELQQFGTGLFAAGTLPLDNGILVSAIYPIAANMTGMNLAMAQILYSNSGGADSGTFIGFAKWTSDPTGLSIDFKNVEYVLLRPGDSGGSAIMAMWNVGSTPVTVGVVASYVTGPVPSLAMAQGIVIPGVLRT